MVRLSLVAALSALVNLATAYPYVIPQPTNTIPFYELNVQLWPLPTAAPGSLDKLLERQALNTVCGYIAGDPNLPATCSAGSHCVVDSDQGVIGCCPDSGSCTQGVFTGCVDLNSGAQTEVNPYVYTCQGLDVCYKNSFEGGYSQFGCGSASNLATTVVATASGKSAVDLTTLPATRTESVTTTDATTKSSTKTSTDSTTSNSKSTTSSSSETTTEAETTTNSSTETQTNSSSQTESDSTSSSTSASAPESDGNNKGKNTGAIVGGTISAVAALVALVALGVFLLRRKKRNQGLNQNSYALVNKMKAASPYANGEYRPGDGNNNIQPLLNPGMQEVGGIRPPPSSMPMPLPTARSTINPVIERDDDDIEPYSSRTNPYGYGSDIGMAVSGDSLPLDHDMTPLTREAREREMREADEFDQGYTVGLERIEEEDVRPTQPHQSPYLGPRGGGGGPLWQQNRGPTWL
ncbi:hypothetical protein BGZ63DRAFT_413117 [Mariannaea sp. PMI_226]|nr:hypothetical protein BGZ63DRAFT_413117 [Mariannaea sp. PMI_226]